MGLFSFLSKNKQGGSEEIDPPLVPRRTRPAKAAEPQEPLDPMLPEKKRARRRLIGATALVLAAIIGLPMIFDSEPKPLADDVAVQIPSHDKPFDKNVDKALPPLPLPEALPPAEPEPEPAKAAAAPEAKLTTPPVAQASHVTAAKEAVPHFYLQVAALTDKVKVKELQDKLKKAEIKSSIQKITTKTGERIRVRVGPFASKAEAEKMRTRLQKMGLTGTLQSV